MPAEMAREAGVVEGSIVVFYPDDGKITAEIISPASSELDQRVQEITEKFADAFAEMKRRGD